MSANKTTTCTCLHTKWQSLFFSKSAACSSESFGVFQVSFSYQHQLPESLKPWRISRFPASKLHAEKAFGLTGSPDEAAPFCSRARRWAQHRHPGVWDQLTGWQTAPPHPAKDLPFDKNMLEVVMDKPVLFDTKKNTELTRVFPMKPSIEMFFSGRGSTICCHVLFKTIHAVMSQMAESRDYDMSVSGKPYQSLLIIGIFWCIVSMKSVQFSVFTGYKCHIARHCKRGMSPSIYITIHIHTFLIFMYYIIHIARCAPWLIW